MSLINDALRKARQAAADHDGQPGRVRPPMAYPSRGSGRGLGAVAVAVIAAAAGIAGAVAVWWATARPVSQPERAVGAPPPTAESGSSPSASDRLTGERPTPAAARSGSDAPPTPPSPTAPGAAPSRDFGQSSSDAPDREQEPTEPATAEAGRRADPRGPPERRGADGARVFVLDAEIGDVSLSLDFIVFRPVRPFAEINGVEVYEGSEVGGFTVETIEADQVTLRDENGPLILKVR